MTLILIDTLHISCEIAASPKQKTANNVMGQGVGRRYIPVLAESKLGEVDKDETPHSAYLSLSLSLWPITHE